MDEKTIEQLEQELLEAKQQIVDLQEVIEKCDKQIAELQALNQELNSEINILSKSKTVLNPTIESNGEQYEIVIPKFIFQGIEVTAEELVSDKEMISDLIKIESPVLKKID